MATAPVLEAVPPAVAERPDTMLVFDIENYGPEIEIDLSQVPLEARMKLLKSAARTYITNRISTVIAKTAKANGVFDQYDAAMKNDPFQTVVPKPAGERVLVPYAETIADATKALYAGEITRRGRPGSGTAKPKVVRDPLVAHITRLVVTEVYHKGLALNSKYKYPTAQKEVGVDGLQYLKDKIEEQVAAAPEAEQAQKRADLNKYLETRYIIPTRIAIGLDVPKTLKDAEGIL